MESTIAELATAIVESGRQLPHTKFSKTLKPYWDQSLKYLNQDKKTARRNWERAGKPRDPDNPIWVAYKQSKREFRKEQRRKVYQYEQSNIEKLVHSETIDQRYFWYIINKRKTGTVPNPK